MEITKKIFKVIIITCFALSCIILPICNAEESNNFDTSAYSGEKETGQIGKATDSVMNAAIVAARTIGVGIALVILIVISCKYMISAPGDRADIKKNAVPYLIGAVVLFGASGILGIIGKFAATISG